MGILFFRLQRLLLKKNSDALFTNKRFAVDLAYKSYGKIVSNEPPIIILHGLLGSKKNWDSISKKIAAATKKSVIAADARNHGKSPHTTDHTYADLISDVARLMETLAIKGAHIIGHSMGGRTGMLLALTEPTKVASLIVVDISPVSTPGRLNSFMPMLLDAMKNIDLHGIKNLSTAKSRVKEELLSSRVVDADSLGFILINLGVKTANTIGWLCNVRVLKDYYSEIASFPNMTGKQYKGRTLFIGGEQSHFIPPTDITEIKKYFPEAELKYVSNAGHNVHAENPNAFLELVIPFLLNQNIVFVLFIFVESIE